MKRTRGSAVAAALLLAGSMVGVAAPASASVPASASASASASGGMSHVRGGAYFDSSGVCPVKKGYTSYKPLVMTGSLKGCWYTHIDQSWTVGGDYLERGREVFVGRLNGGPRGTFKTVYLFEAKLAADGSEISGQCQHPIVPGSGRGGFRGKSGILYFRDIVTTDPLTYVYTGHID